MPSKPTKAAAPKVVQLPYESKDYGLLDELKSRGRDFKKMSALEVELYMFARGPVGSTYFIDKTPNPAGKPRAYHFWRAAQMLWNYPGSLHPVHIHPWAIRMVDALCKHKRLSIAGCASSGKSRTLALWGIINFISAPRQTKVIFTSTSLKDSRGRIWGDVEKLWSNMVAQGPGQLVSSSGLIRYWDPATDDKDDTRGLVLLAGEKSKETESIGKMKGFKAERMVFIADELPDLSEALISAAESNLAANQYFQFVGTGNPSSYYDPHGILSEPVNGWSSISESDYEWQGKKAYVIRFDAEKSPNFDSEGEKWPYLMTHKRLMEYKERLGERSLGYYCMVKGFWYSEAGEDLIYSGADLQSYKCLDKAIFRGVPKFVAGFDPSFTNGGDRSMLTIGRVGEDINGQVTIERVESLALYEDATNTLQSRSEQIALQVIAKCESYGVKPEDLAIDATGGGSPWCDMLASKWKTNAFIRVQFGGEADDKDQYANKVSELWFSGQKLVRSGQLKGVVNSLAKEMTTRKYELKNKRIRVLPKSDMRSKLGHSPDESDSFFLMIYAAQKKHKLVSSERLGSGPNGNGFKKAFRKFAEIYDVA